MPVQGVFVFLYEECYNRRKENKVIEEKRKSMMGIW